MTETTMIGAYEVAAQIGAGGMATVYKAYQPKLDRHVAIKVMHDTFAADPQFLARFEREARIVARLDHPNIVPVYDYDEYEGKPYLVMKYIEGVTLKDILRKNTLSSTETLNILGPVADALHYAHLQGVLHRDVKPSNIILDTRGTPYLTDFGLARIAQSGESTISVDSMLGTPHYISPEQAQAETDLDARTDVYSLGVVLYELVTGQVPFASETSYAIIHSHIYDPPPPPRQINPEIQPQVEAVVLKALEKQPANRYVTPVDMLNAYKDALGGQKVPPPPMVEPPVERKPSSGRKQVNIPVPPTTPGTPQPPARRRDDDNIFAEIGEDLREAGEEIREELGEAWREIRDAWRSSSKGNRHMWRPGAKWTTGPDGEQGFYTEEELRRAEDDLPEEERIRRRVEKRLKERREFRSHLSSYVLVNLFMIFIWAATDAGYFWPIWVIGPWGIGLAFHAVNYWNEHGGGRFRAERTLIREIEAERRREAMLRGDYDDDRYEKAKNDLSYDAVSPRVRLNEDGEFTESFVDELDEAQKRKR